MVSKQQVTFYRLFYRLLWLESAENSGCTRPCFLQKEAPGKRKVSAIGSKRKGERESRSVSRVLSWTVIHLGRFSQIASSNLPDSSAGNALESYLVLLRVGFTLPRTVASRAVRSYRTFSPLPALQGRLRRLFSVALSVGSRLPGVTWHLALWSPDFPPPPLADNFSCKSQQRLSDRLSLRKGTLPAPQLQAIRFSCFFIRPEGRLVPGAP